MLDKTFSEMAAVGPNDMKKNEKWEQNKNRELISWMENGSGCHFKLPKWG